MTDIAALLAEARRPERTIEVCLRGDLRAEWELLDEQLREAEKKPRTSLGEEGPVELAQQVEALQEQMKSSIVTLRLRAMPRREWTSLVAEHPPRPDAAEDKGNIVNMATFFDVAAPRTIVEPELTDGQFEQLADAISNGQWTQLANAVWAVNAGSVDVPFSHAASRISRKSAETSKQPNDSA